jgi:predicted permease
VTGLLEVVAPLFGIVALGFLAARLRILEERGVQGLVLFVFNFAIPVLLFRSTARMDLPDDVAWSFLIAFYAGSFTTYGLGLAVGRFLFGRPLDEQAIFGMGAGYSNNVLLGIPIVLTAYGPEATLPLFLIIGLHSALLLPVTVALIQAGRGAHLSWREQVGGVAWELLKNPIVAGLLLGFLANASGLALPGPVDRLAELLGAAAVPTALFAMGASLAAYHAQHVGAPTASLAALKLLVHPFLVWVLAAHVFGLEGVWMTTAVTLAAMPSGVNTYLFAARYDAAAPVASRTVLVTSTLSVVTLSVVLALLA